MPAPATNICAAALMLGVALATGSALAATAADPGVLAGTWRFATFSDKPLPSANDPGTEDATLTIDTSGSITSGTWSDSWDDSGGFSGGTLTVDTDGKVDGSLVYTGDISGTESFSAFRLSPDNDVILGLDTTLDGYYALVLAAKGGTGFVTSDVAGTWHFVSLFDEKAPSTGSAGWTRATITVNSSGVIISGSGVESDLGTFTLTGSMSVNIDGAVTLSVTATDSGGSELFVIDSLRMATSKNVIGGVFGDVEDAEIAVMIKAGNSYSTADLAGTWYAFSFEDREAGHDPGWTRSFFTVNSSGAVTGGEDVEADGTVTPITSGSFSISSDGAVSGTIDGETVGSFRMDASKNFIGGANSESDGDRLISILVKGSSITALDRDGDGVIDSEDAFPSDPTETTDTDSDGIGNNADTDDDNDGISDVIEISLSLDPLNPADATQDADGDGTNNLDEVLAGTNPRDPTSNPGSRSAVMSVINHLLDDE